MTRGQALQPAIKVIDTPGWSADHALGRDTNNPRAVWSVVIAPTAPAAGSTSSRSPTNGPSPERSTRPERYDPIEEAAMTAKYKRAYPRPGIGTPQHEQLHLLFQTAQTLAIDLEDYAHHHTNQAREIAEVAPLLLRARDTLRAIWQRTAPLPVLATDSKSPWRPLPAARGRFMSSYGWDDKPEDDKPEPV
jgi:hypothetical protein